MSVASILRVAHTTFELVPPTPPDKRQVPSAHQPFGNPAWELSLDFPPFESVVSS
jgi:hypothetical protein